MPTITSSKFFSETVTLGGASATRLADLMRTAGYGFEKDANNAITTTPSLDSFIGGQCFIIPQTYTAWVGHDQYVSSSALAAPPPRLYQGVPAAAGESFNVVQNPRGIIDANNIWLYSDFPQSVSIVFVAA